MVARSRDLFSAERAIQIASSEDEVYAAIGLHPWIAKLIDDATYRNFLGMANKSKVVAISGKGLDNVRSRASKEEQLQALAAMLRLAQDTSFPIILHDKGYHKEMMEMLRNEKFLLGCVHDFEGNARDLKEWLDLGYYISVKRSVLGAQEEKL